MVRIAYFDDADIPWASGSGPATDDSQAAVALDSFRALGPSDRRTDSRHVMAYYREVRDVVGAEFLDEEMGVTGEPGDIWRHVRPRSMRIETEYDDNEHVYLVVECDCDWEQEHGMMMVWRDGKALSKVSGYDGHWTNEGEDAYGNRYGPDVIYAGASPEFTTRTVQP